MSPISDIKAVYMIAQAVPAISAALTESHILFLGVALLHSVLYLGG